MSIELPANVVQMVRKRSREEIEAILTGPDPRRVVCPKCLNDVVDLREDGVLPDAHTCCRCADTGRYRLRGKLVECDACTPALDVITELRRRGFPEETLGAEISAIQTEREGGAVALKLWASNFPDCAQNITLVGPPGAGKTYAGVALCKAILATKGALPWFSTTTTLLQRLRDTMREEARETEASIMSGLKRVPVLMLDDVGREQGTDWAQSRLFDLLNHRWSSKLHTIATANMDTWLALPEHWKSRLASGHLVSFEKLPDRRLARAKPTTRRML